MEKKKYIIQVNRVRGTVLTGKKGDVIELSAGSDEVKSLVDRGWIIPMKETTNEDVIEETEVATEETEAKPKKATKTKK